ncbi:MAG: hypothetical protein JO111_08465 [Caulobacteraceae bacterium]|nr:hypothetical protein [Caulobacteraceae bacterium]
MTPPDQAASEAFIAALEAGDLEGVRRAPEGEAHTHGPFGGDRDWLAGKTGQDIAPLTRPLASMAELHAWTAAHVGDPFKDEAGRRLGWQAAFVRGRGAETAKQNSPADIYTEPDNATSSCYCT